MHLAPKMLFNDIPCTKDLDVPTHKVGHHSSIWSNFGQLSFSTPITTDVGTRVNGTTQVWWPIIEPTGSQHHRWCSCKQCSHNLHDPKSMHKICTISGMWTSLHQRVVITKSWWRCAEVKSEGQFEVDVLLRDEDRALGPSSNCLHTITQTYSEPTQSDITITITPNQHTQTSLHLKYSL